MKPQETTELWTNLYHNKQKGTMWCGVVYSTKLEAENIGKTVPNYKTTIKLNLDK
jgi:hypothetical protein